MASSTYDIDYTIVWLDQNIALKDRYKILKEAFSTTLNPKVTTPTSIDEFDYSHAILEHTASPTTTNNDSCVFKLFDDLDECEKYLLANAGKKRVFFITSGALGQYLVPKILNHYPQVFQDKNGEFYEKSIYIFCANMKAHAEWAYDFLDFNCIQIFTDDQMVLFRLTRDLADYLRSKGKEMYDVGDINSVTKALEYFGQTKALLLHAEKVWPPGKDKKLLDDIDRLIDETERKIRELEGPDRDD